MHYLRIVGQGHGNQVWRIQRDEALPLGLYSSLGPSIRRNERATIWAALQEDTPWVQEEGGPETGPFHLLDLAPGHYYPRIARPLNGSLAHPKSPSASLDSDTLALAVGQANTLMRRLDIICQTVHPASETLETYGHEIRNLLILASTEVEAHWRGILFANGLQKSRYTMNDYSRLLPVLRLDQYAIGYRSFPWLRPMRPFAGWDSQNPTRSLAWYDAYNHVKHDRDGGFSHARLDHAFSAVTACAIMLVAQYTPSIGLGGYSDLSAFFHFVETPKWSLSESYSSVSSMDELEWKSVHHPKLKRTGDAVSRRRRRTSE